MFGVVVSGEWFGGTWREPAIVGGVPEVQARAGWAAWLGCGSCRLLAAGFGPPRACVEGLGGEGACMLRRGM